MKKVHLLLIIILLFQCLVSADQGMEFELTNPFQIISLEKNESFAYTLIAKNLVEKDIKINLTYSIPTNWSFFIPSNIYLSRGEKKIIEAKGRVPENCEIGAYNITIVAYTEEWKIRIAKTVVLISSPPNELELNITFPLYLKTGYYNIFEIGIKNLVDGEKKIELSAFAPYGIYIKFEEKKLSIAPYGEEKFNFELNSNIEGRQFFLLLVNKSYGWTIPIIASDGKIDFTYEDINANLGAFINARIGLNYDTTTFEIFLPSNFILNNVIKKGFGYEANISVQKNSSPGYYFVLWSFEIMSKKYFVYNTIYLYKEILKRFQVDYIHSIGAYFGENFTYQISMKNTVDEKIELSLSIVKNESWDIELEFYNLILDGFEYKSIEVKGKVPIDYPFGTSQHKLFINDTNGYCELIEINVILNKRSKPYFAFGKFYPIHSPPNGKFKTQTILHNIGEDRISISLSLLAPENWSWEIEKNFLSLEKDSKTLINITVYVPLGTIPGEYYLFLFGEANGLRNWVELLVFVETIFDFSLDPSLKLESYPGSKIDVFADIENFGEKRSYKAQLLVPKKWIVEIDEKDFVLLKNEVKRISAKIEIPLDESDGSYYIEWLVTSNITKRASTIVSLKRISQSFIFLNVPEIKLKPGDYGEVELVVKNLLEIEIEINFSIFSPDIFQILYYTKSVVLSPLNSSEIFFSFFVKDSALPNNYNIELIGKDNYSVNSIILKVIVGEKANIEINIKQDYVNNTGNIIIDADRELSSIEVNVTYPDNKTYSIKLIYDGKFWYGSYDISLDGYYFILLKCIDTAGYRFIRGVGNFVKHSYDVYLKIEGKNFYRKNEEANLKIIIRNIGNSPDNYSIFYIINDNKTYLSFCELLPNATFKTELKLNIKERTKIYFFVEGKAKNESFFDIEIESEEKIFFKYTKPIDIEIVLLPTGLLLFGLVLVFFNESSRYFLIKSFLPLIIPLYSRVAKEKVLDNNVRMQIYKYVSANPGDNYTIIKSKLKLENGVIAHHMKILEANGILKSVRDGIYRRFYPVGLRLPKKEIDGLSWFQIGIYNKIRERPGITQREIAEFFHVSKQVVNYHVMLMENAELIELVPLGKEKGCYVIGK
ncbi:MAG: winged helix-turn-helix transcriptional regulator [Candidatus Thermoplasmatota archaeon]